MRVQITGRHIEISAQIRAHAEQALGKLKKYDPNLSAADLIFREEGRSTEAEGILHLDGSDLMVAKGRGAEEREALDDLIDKLARMLRRNRERRTQHKATSFSEATSEE